MAAKTSPTAEVWRERILAQQASGQSVRGWCRANNCPEHGFYWWRATLGLSPASASRRPRRGARPTHFAEVVVERPAAESIVLRLGSGRELILPPSMPMARLAELPRAVEGAAS